MRYDSDIHFVLPSLPAMRPMARPCASLPMTCLTSRISKVSTTVLSATVLYCLLSARELLTVKIVQTQQRNSIINVEAQGKGLDKVLALLQGAVLGGVLGCAELDLFPPRVHADLKLEVLDERGVDCGRALVRQW